MRERLRPTPAVIGALIALALTAGILGARRGEEAAGADGARPAAPSTPTTAPDPPSTPLAPTTPPPVAPTSAPRPVAVAVRDTPAPPAADPTSALVEGAGQRREPVSDDADDRLEKPGFAANGKRLPTRTALALPPMIRVVARPSAAPVSALATRVLGASRLVLSPGARSNIESGKVEATALALLLHTRRGRTPLLVYGANGRELEFQETSLSTTQATVALLDGLPARAAPADLRLKAVRPDLADTGRSREDPGSVGSLGRRAADLALSFQGTPYVWGGAGPRQGFDCSGLVQYVYGQLGIALTHYAAFQFREGDPVDSRDLRAGDLLFFNPKADGPGHVGIYIGNGLMVHAPRRGDVVRIADVASRAGRYMGAVRPY